MNYLPGLVLASGLLIWGCGQMSTSASPTSAPSVVSKQGSSPASVVNNVTVPERLRHSNPG